MKMTNLIRKYKDVFLYNVLEKLRFKVYGLRGWKWIRGETASIKRKPRLLWDLLAFLSEIILYSFPSLCFNPFAVKKIG